MTVGIKMDLTTRRLAEKITHSQVIFPPFPSRSRRIFSSERKKESKEETNIRQKWGREYLTEKREIKLK